MIPYSWLEGDELVDPSAPSDLADDVPLPADGKHVAIVGGGLAGLTTAYYMASVVKPSTKITIYEAEPRLGGWVRTDQVPVDVGGKKGIVNFERGPRSLSALGKNRSRYDDLVFYDLVSQSPYPNYSDLEMCPELTDHAVGNSASNSASNHTSPRTSLATSSTPTTSSKCLDQYSSSCPQS